MKTVAEANKHVCVQAAGNETAVVCRADICMAWRWELSEAVRVYDGEHGVSKREEQRGYCGLTVTPD